MYRKPRLWMVHNDGKPGMYTHTHTHEREGERERRRRRLVILGLIRDFALLIQQVYDKFLIILQEMQET